MLARIHEAIVLNPPSAILTNGRATVLFRCGRQDEAIAEFKVAIKMDPTYSYHEKFSNQIQKIRSDAEAQETMKQAIEIERNNGK
jgi:tetratricopeptide (TPR) repeat protein